MRRGLVPLLIVMMIVLVAGAVGCGSASSAATGEGADSPEAILAATIGASAELTSATGSFDVELSFDADLSQIPEEGRAMAQPFLEEPIEVAGTFAVGSDQQNADLSVSLTMAGSTMDIGMKLVEEKMYLSLLDQWYEAPPEFMESMDQSSFDEAKAEEMMALIEELGVEPVTWMKDLSLVGEENLDGVAVYHLSGVPDLAKMVGDAMGLMESEEFLALIDPTGMMTGSMEQGMTMMGADELQEMQDQISDMFKDVKIDMWVAKDTYMLHKVTVDARIIPPEGEDMEGLNAIDLSVAFTLQNVNQPVTVEAPDSALPFEQLEEAMMENPEALMGPFMGLFGAGFGGGDLSY